MATASGVGACGVSLERRGQPVRGVAGRRLSDLSFVLAMIVLIIWGYTTSDL